MEEVVDHNMGENPTCGIAMSFPMLDLVLGNKEKNEKAWNVLEVTWQRKIERDGSAMAWVEGFEGKWGRLSSL